MNQAPTTPDYDQRLGHVRAALVEQQLDAILVLGPANRRYLTGFTAHDGDIGESSGAVLVTPDRATLLVSPLYIDQARAESAVEPRELKRRYVKDLPPLLKEWNLRRIGFERDYTLYGLYEDLTEGLDGQGELLPVKGVVEALRIRKDPAEQGLIREAARIADEAFARVVGELRPGVTERRVARLLEDTMIGLGAEGPSFPTIVAAGPNSARPHHEPGEAPIRAGEPIVIDMGARYHGYCSDLTRSFCLGAADDRYREIHALVLRAHLAAAGALRDGLVGKDADAVARGVIADAGRGEEFGHGLGHGVGLDIHEKPSLGKESEDTLGAGMVVTVEPGVYISGWGGVRIEDLVLVTPEGGESWSQAPKDAVI
jgi:Xaa-Pro aminopeptidase